MERIPCRSASVLVLVLVWGLACSGTCWGQGAVAPAPQPVAPTPEEPPRPTADNLDALLDMADRDVAQLAQVRLAGLTGSPSLDVPVSTVARQESTVGRSPAAVFVITSEMIRRSGAKNLPDVLRMAPGVNVARIDSNKWAISIRGFNGRFVSNLLMQIDARAVYTPVFGGVFWDVQDLPLETIERIEVIRGPGASVWGANAVNGIINIITKKAKDTQGVYVETGVGTEELGYSTLQAGGRAGEDLYYRVYGKWFERGAGYNADMPADDDWRQARGGFRTDWTPNVEDTLTLQGDCYNGYSGDRAVFPTFAAPPYYYMNHDNTHVSGENAVFHWRRVMDEDSDWTLWLYYDRTERHWGNYGLSEDRDTFDFDFQRRFPLGARHSIICGCGYRNTKDFVHASATYGMTPDHRSDNIFSYFVQDEIALVEDLWYVTLGSKFEHNDYTNFEYQPTVRVLWTPDDRRSVWGAISRAVRTPSRGESNALATVLPLPPSMPVPYPTFPVMNGNPDLLSEELIAYELGYRVQTTKRFSWDFTTFLFDYEHLIMSRFGLPQPGPVPGTFIMPGTFTNDLAGKAYGFELASNYELTSRWRLQSSYSFLVLDLAPVLGSQVPERIEGQSPRNQFFLGCFGQLGPKWELDVMGRYVDSLATDQIGSYFAADVRLAYCPCKHFEWSIVGRNLLVGNHPEFGNDSYLGSLRTEVQQEVYTQIVLRR